MFRALTSDAYFFSAIDLHLKRKCRTLRGSTDFSMRDHRRDAMLFVRRSIPFRTSRIFSELSCKNDGEAVIACNTVSAIA